MPLRLTILLALAGIAYAQTGCTSVNFLTARDANLKPSATSHIDLIRQTDGSYTAFEVTDAAPYLTLNATPHFEKQFAACLPHTSPASPVLPLTAANPAGAGSQLQASFTLASGNIFVASIGSNGVPLHFDLFDSQHNLLSETTFTYSAPDPAGSPFSRDDTFNSLTLADMNNDGHLDLIAVFSTNRLLGRIDGGVWVFPGNGDGTFAAGKRQVLNSVSMLRPAYTVAVADINRDGKADLVMPIPSTGNITVALGNGDGTFNPKTTTVSIPNTFQQEQRGVALADLNGDGNPDLVATAQQLSANVVGVALGNGDGSFQPAVFYPALVAASHGATVAIGDLNGDHIPDIVTSGGTILFGDGKGTFPSRRDYPPGVSETASVLLADFDGDGKTDILFGNGNSAFLSGNSLEPTLTVMLAGGNGLFNAAQAFKGSPESGTPAVIADFDNDGLPDGVFVFPNSTGLQIVTVQGQGNGAFAPLSTQSFPLLAVTSLRAADFKGDGKQDLAVLSATVSGNQLLIYAGRGNGTFDAPIPTTLGQDRLLAVADFNRDGIPDLVTSGDFISVWLGKGDGTFTVHPTSVAVPVYPPGTDGSAPGATTSDFNGDGKLDLAIAAAGVATLIVLPGKGDGTFQSAITTPLADVATGGDLIASADFDGDGRADLILELGKPNDGTAAKGAVLLGKGDGTFAPALIGPPVLVRIADINGDKIPDLVGSGGAGIAIRLGNGDGTFQPDYFVPAGGGPIAIADFNRDGVPDIAALSYDGSLFVYLNLSRPAPALTVVSAASFAPGSLAPGAIAAAFGENLAASTSSATTSLPYTLSGVTVAVQDSAGHSRLAPLFFVSRTQFNFQIPPATATGLATITASGTLSGGPVSTSIQIAAIAPSLFTVGPGIAAAYALSVAPDGTTTTVPVFATQVNTNPLINVPPSIVAAPIDVTQPGQVYVILFGTGFDSAGTSTVSANIQGLPATVTYAGPQPTLTGLDQVNVLIPRSLAGTGIAGVTISVGGSVSNTVHFAIK